MKSRLFAFGASLILVGAIAGCPGTLDDPGRFVVSGATPDDAAVLDSAVADASAPPAPVAEGADSGDCPDIPQVLASTCTGASCHSASNKAQGLDLASPGVSSRLVDVPATEGSGLLVDPSAPSKSVLYLKLTSNPPFGARMPLGATSLDASTLACVLAWVGTVGQSAADTDAGGGHGTDGSAIHEGGDE
jgi:hypothetical protein